jgi:hypothetical protein
MASVPALADFQTGRPAKPTQETIPVVSSGLKKEDVSIEGVGEKIKGVGAKIEGVVKPAEKIEGVVQKNVKTPFKKLTDAEKIQALDNEREQLINLLKTSCAPDAVKRLDAALALDIKIATELHKERISIMKNAAFEYGGNAFKLIQGKQEPKDSNWMPEARMLLSSGVVTSYCYIPPEHSQAFWTYRALHTS